MAPYRIILIIVTILSFQTSWAQKLWGETIEHGMYDVEIAQKEKVETTLTQSMNLLKSQKLLFTTDTIIAEIGKTFGMQFMLKSNDGGTYALLLKAVWEFPKPMINPYNHKVYKDSFHEQYYITNQPAFHSYSLEYDYELVEGWWTFKLMQADKVIYEKKFWVFRPL